MGTGLDACACVSSPHSGRLPKFAPDQDLNACDIATFCRQRRLASRVRSVGGVFLEREAGDLNRPMDARSGRSRSPDRAHAYRRAIPSGLPSLRFRLKCGRRGNGPHLRVSNALPCGRVLAPRRRKRPTSGPCSTTRAKLAGGGLPSGYRPHGCERGAVAVACRRVSSDFGGFANVDMD